LGFKKGKELTREYYRVIELSTSSEGESRKGGIKGENT